MSKKKRSQSSGEEEPMFFALDLQRLLQGLNPVPIYGLVMRRVVNGCQAGQTVMAKGYTVNEAQDTLDHIRTCKDCQASCLQAGVHHLYIGYGDTFIVGWIVGQPGVITDRASFEAMEREFSA